MIGLPSSWIATSAGALFGLSLGIPGVVLGVLAGRLLDSVFADMRARAAISSLLSGATAPKSPITWRELFVHPLYSAYVRDARALGFGRGAEEYVLLISVAMEFHRGAAVGVEPPAELCDAVGKYLQQRCELRVRGLRRLCSLVYRASRTLTPVDRLRLLSVYAGDYDREKHHSFLRSLIPEYPDGAQVINSEKPGVSEATTDVPISPRLVWDDRASELLGLDDFASEAEVRAAFRERARSLHPDVQGDSGEFISLREAYETMLSRFGARSAGQAPEAFHKDPHNRAQSDTRC